MRMSHIYQPVMLKTLLSNKGTASIEQIARDILSNDESQVDYYESITALPPQTGPVLELVL